MESLVLHPTSTAQWHALVNEGEAECALELGEDLESYLVYMLMRYISKPEIAKSVLAVEFLEGLESIGAIRSDRLQELADKCLLFSGLFPERAKRRHVQVSYYVDLGQIAYYELSQFHEAKLAELYTSLCEEFRSLQNVLFAMRHENVFKKYGSLGIGNQNKIIQPLDVLNKIILH